MNAQRLPRRELLRLAGLSGLAVATAGLVGPRPLIALADSTQDDTPEGFLAATYAKRAQAMTTGDTNLLDQIYDPTNAALLAFEKERARFFSKASARGGAARSSGIRRPSHCSTCKWPVQRRRPTSTRRLA